MSKKSNDQVLGREDLDRYGAPKNPINEERLRRMSSKKVRPLTFQGNQYDAKYEKGLTLGGGEQTAKNINQSGWEMFKNFAVRSAVGEIMAGSVENFGYMSGLVTEAIYGHEEGEEMFHNAMSEWGKSIKEELREDYPIYEATPGEFNMGDPAWWAENGVSVSSTFGLILPAAGIVGGVGRGLKLIKGMEKLATKYPQLARLAEATATAGLSRTAESSLESTQTFDEVRQKYMGLTNPSTGQLYTDQESRSIAGRAAADTYNYNWYAMLTDIPQYYLMMRGTVLGKAGRAAAKKKVLDRASKIAKGEKVDMPKITIPQKIGKYGSVGATEGIEEVYQHNVQEEAARWADVQEGQNLDSHLDFLERVVEQSTSGQARTAGFFGAMGGMSQQIIAGGAISARNKLKGRKQEKEEAAMKKKFEALADKMELFSGYHDLMTNAINNGDEGGFNFASALSNIGVAWDKVKNGQFEENDQIVDDHVKRAEADENVSEEGVAIVKTKAEELKADTRKMAAAYKTAKNTFNKTKSKVKNAEAIIDIIAKNNFLKGVVNENIAAFTANIAELENNYKEELGPKTTVYRLITEKLEAYSLAIDVLKEELTEPNITKEAKARKETLIKKYEVASKKKEAEATKLKEELKEAKEKLDEFAPRVDIIANKAEIIRSTNTVSMFDAANKKLHNAKNIKKADGIIQKNKEEAEKLAKEEDQENQDLEEKGDLEVKNAEVKEEAPKEETRGATDWKVYKQAKDAINSLGRKWLESQSGPAETPVFPALEKWIKSLLDGVAAAGKTTEFRKMFGNIVPQNDGELQARGTQSPSGKVPIGIHPSSPSSTANALAYMLNKKNDAAILKTLGSVANPFEQLQEVRDVITNLIDGVSQAAEVTEAIEDEANESEETRAQDSPSNEDATEHEEAAPKVRFVNMTAFYNSPSETNTPWAKGLFDFLYINDPNGLKEGDVLQISVERHDEKNDKYENDNTRQFYEMVRDGEITLTSKNIPIKIEAKKNGKWVTIGRVPDANTIQKEIDNKKDKRSLEIMEQAERLGFGLPQLIAFREKAFKAQKKKFKSKVKSKTYGKPGYSRGASKTALRATKEEISYYGSGEIVLAGLNGVTYYVRNNKKIQAAITDKKGNPKNVGHTFAVVESSNGQPYLISLDTVRLQDVENGVEAIMALIKSLPTAESTLEVVRKINEITAEGKSTMNNIANFNFQASKTQVKIGLPGEKAKVYKIKGMDTALVAQLLSTKKLNVVSALTNSNIEYVNPINKALGLEEKRYGTYNDYVAEFATTTNFTNKWTNTRFSFENPDPTPVDTVEDTKEEETESKDNGIVLPNLGTKTSKETKEEEGRQDLPNIPLKAPNLMTVKTPKPLEEMTLAELKNIRKQLRQNQVKMNEKLRTGGKDLTSRKAFIDSDYTIMKDYIDRLERGEENILLGIKSKDLTTKIRSLARVEAFLTALGVDIQLHNFGNTPSLAAANFIEGIIQITDKFDDRAEAWNKLPEEAAHFWFRMLKEDSSLKTQLWDLVKNQPAFKDLQTSIYAKQYSTKNALQEEAIGQIIARIITNIENGTATTKERTFWQKFVDFIKGIIGRTRIEVLSKADPFVIAAERVLNSDLTDLLTLEEYKAAHGITTGVIPITDNTGKTDRNEFGHTVEDVDSYVEALLGRKYRRRTRFLPKTITKLVNMVNQVINSKGPIDKETISDDKLKAMAEAHGYHTKTPTLESFNKLIQIYKANGIPAANRLAVKGIKKVELDLLNEVRELIVKEHAEKQAFERKANEQIKKSKARLGVKHTPIQIGKKLKTIDVHDFINEVKVYLEANYKLGFNYERYNSGYRMKNITGKESPVTFYGHLADGSYVPVSQLDDITKEDGIHRKISMRFNDGAFKNVSNHSNHFHPTPVAFGSLLTYDNGNKVLLHEIQSDVFEELLELLKTAPVVKGKVNLATLTPNQVFEHFKYDHFFTDTIKKIVDLRGGEFEVQFGDDLVKELYDKLKERIQESEDLIGVQNKDSKKRQQDLLKAIDFSNQVMSDLFTAFSILRDVRQRKKIGMFTGQKQWEKYLAEKKDVKDKGSVVFTDMPKNNVIKDFENEVQSVYKASNGVMAQLYMILRDGGAAFRTPYNMGFVNSFDYSKLKHRMLSIQKQNIGGKYRELAQLRKLEWYNSITKDQFGKIAENIEHNIRLLDDSMKKGPVKPKVVLGRETFDIKKELGYFTPLVHHLLQTFRAGAKSGASLYWPAYRATQLAQGASTATAGIYASPMDVKNGVAAKVGPLFALMSKMKGIRLEYREDIGLVKTGAITTGQDGDATSYSQIPTDGYEIIFDDDYNFQEPVLYALKEKPKTEVIPTPTELPLAPVPTPRYSRWDEQKARTWLAEKLPDLEVSVIDGLIEVGGKKSYGLFQNDVIYLAKTSKVGQEFHEAFHGVFNAFLSQEQRNEVLIEAQIESGRQGDKNLEEWLAERFRNHMLGDRVSPKLTGISRFFEAIRSFFKWVTNKPMTMAEIFNHLEDGGFKENIVRKKNNNGSYKVTRHMLIDSFSVKEQQRRVTMLAHQVWSKIEAQIEDGTIKEESEANLVQILDEIKQWFHSSVNTEDGYYKQQGASKDQTDAVQKMVDNFDKLVPEVIRFFKNFGIITKNEDFFNTEDRVDDLNLEYNDQSNNDASLPHFEISKKENASPIIKRYVALMLSSISDDIGFREPLDFHRTFSTLLEGLSGLDSFEEMKERVAEIGVDKGEFEVLAQDLETATEQFKSAFFSTFANQHEKHLTMASDSSGFTIYKTNRRNVRQLLMNDWQDNFERDEEHSTIIKGETRPITLKFKQYAKEAENLANLLRVNKRPVEKGEINQVIHWFRTLGIELSKESVSRMGKDSRMLGKFMSTSLGKNETGGLIPLLNKAASGKNPYSKDPEHSEGSTISSIASLEARFKTDRYTSSFKNGKNNLVNGITAQSFMSKLFTNLKNPAKAHTVLNEYFRDPLYKLGNIVDPLLAKFQVLDGKFTNEEFVSKFEWAVFDSLKYRGRVKAYEELNSKEKIRVDLELFLNATGEKGWGWFFSPTPADKPNNNVIKLPKYTQRDGYKALVTLALQEHARVAKNLKALKEKDPSYISEDRQIESYHKGQQAAKFVTFPYLNKILIKNGNMVPLTDNVRKAVREAIQTSMNTEVDKYLIETSNKDGLRVWWAQQGSTDIINTILSSKSVKEYVGDKGAIDTKAIIRDFVLNATIYNITLTKMLAGDPAFYKSADVLNKRFSQAITTGPRYRVSDEGGVASHFRTLIFDDVHFDLSDILGIGYKRIESTDAQGLVSLDYYVQSLKARGEWTPKHDLALPFIKRGESTPVNNSLFLKPLKTFTFDLAYDAELGMMIPIQIKHSVIPLIPLLVNEGKDNKLKLLADLLDREVIDEVNYLSGIKEGARNILNMEELLNMTEEEQAEVVERSAITVSHANRMIVQETPNASKPTKFGSQIRRLIMGGVKDATMYNVVGYAQPITGAELKKAYHSLINDNLKDLADNLIKNIKNPSWLAKTIIDQFSDRGLANNVEKTLEIDGSGNFKYPFVFPGMLRKVENILSALFRNNVTSTKMFGYSAVQFSSYGLDPDLKMVTNKDGKITHAQIAISEVMARKLGITEIGWLTEKTRLKIGVNARRGIMYHIPTQEKSSMLPVEIVKVLPKELGNVAHFPIATVAQMGIDFDIDKNTILLRDPDPKSEVSRRNNRVIDIMEAVLTNQDHWERMINPIGNKTIGNSRRIILEEQEGEKKGARGSFENKLWSSPFTQYKYHETNMAGKALIGKTVVQSMHHVVSYHAPYKLSIPVTYGVRHAVTELGNDPVNKIAGLISEYINIAVDNANDPIAGDVGINLDNIGIVLLLIRAGAAPHDIHLFLNNQIIKDYSRGLKKYDGSKQKAIDDATRIYKKDNFSKEYEEVSANVGEYAVLGREDVTKADTTKKENADILHAYITLSEVAGILSKDIALLRFDTSKGVGQTLSDKEVYIEGLKDNDNLLNQIAGFPMLEGFLEHGITRAYEIISEIIPTGKRAFKSLHKAMHIPASESGARDAVNGAFLLHTLTDPLSPISKIFSRVNKNRLLKAGSESLWSRVKEIRNELKVAKLPNDFLDSLLPDLKNEDGLDYVLFNGRAKYTSDERTMLSEFWLQLFKSENEKHVALARDLFEYSLVTEGFGFAPDGFGELRPAEYWIDSEYSNTDVAIYTYWASVMEKLSSDTYSSAGNFIDQFLRNHGNSKMKYKFVVDITALVRGLNKKNPKNTKIFKNKDTKEMFPTSILIHKDDLNPVYKGRDIFSYTNGEKRTVFLKIVGKKGDMYVLNLVDGKGEFSRVFETSAAGEEVSVLPENNIVADMPVSSFFTPDEFYQDEDGGLEIAKQDIETSFETVEEEKEDFVEEAPAVDTSVDEAENIPDEADDWLKQKESTSVEKPNKDLNLILKQFLQQHGISVTAVDEILTRSGDNAIAAANLTKRIIKIVKGLEKEDTLPEEASHIFVRMMGLESPLVRRMMSVIDEFIKNPQMAPIELREIVERTLEGYKGEFEGNLEGIKEEIVGKILAQALVDNFKSKSAKKSVLQSLYATAKLIYNKIKSIFVKIPMNDLDNFMAPFNKAATHMLTNKPVSNSIFTHDNKGPELILYQKTEKEEIIITPEQFINKRISEVKRIKAVVEHAIDVLFKKEGILGRVHTDSSQEAAGELRNVRLDIERKIKRGLEREALLSFIESSITPLATARDKAESIQNSGIDGQTSGELSMVRALSSAYQTAKAYEFIDEVLLMAIQMKFSNKDVALLKQLQADKNTVISIYKLKLSEIPARFLVPFSSNMSEEEISVELQRGSKDITWQDRYIRAMSQSSDKILQLIDKAVRVTKEEARHAGRRLNHELTAHVEKLKDKTGYNVTAEVLYDKYLERDTKGVLTGYFKSKYIAEFYEKKAKVHRLRKESADKREAGFETEANKLGREATALNNTLEVRYETGTVPLGKYLNKEYDALLKDEFWLFVRSSMLDAIYRLPPSKRKLYSGESYDRIKLPSVRKTFIERVVEQGGSALKASMHDALVAHEQDTEFGLLDEAGNPVGQIPVHFQGRIDVKDLSFDVGASVQIYYNMAMDASAMGKIIDNLEMTKDALRERKVNVLDSRGMNPIKDLRSKRGENRTIDGIESNIYKRLVDYMEATLYGQLKKKSGTYRNPITGVELDRQKVHGAFLKYNAILSLATNVLSAVANPIIGGVLQMAEAAGGEFYNAKDYTLATATYATAMADGSLAADIVNGKNRSKINLLNELFGSIQEYGTYDKGTEEVKNRYGRMFTGTSGFFMHNAGEHWLQSRIMIAMLNGHTWRDAPEGKGKFVKKKEGDTSAWDQFSVKDGKVYLDGKAFDGGYWEKNRTDESILLGLKMITINQRMHGNYTDIDRTAFHRDIVGQWVFQFRNWMVAGYDRRWGDTRYDTRLGQDVEGNYRTAVKFLNNMAKDLRQGQFEIAARWDKMSVTEKANIKRTGMEMAYMVGVFALSVFMGGLGSGDDEDDEGSGYAMNFMAYQIERLWSELVFFYNPIEAGRLLDSPAAGVSTFGKLASLFSALIPWNWSDQYQSGSRKGTYKLPKYMAEVTPLWRDIDKNRHIEHILQYFQD